MVPESPKRLYGFIWTVFPHFRRDLHLGHQFEITYIIFGGDISTPLSQRPMRFSGEVIITARTRFAGSRGQYPSPEAHRKVCDLTYVHTLHWYTIPFTLTSYLVDPFFTWFHLCLYIPCYTQYHSRSSQTSHTQLLSLESFWDFTYVHTHTYISIPNTNLRHHTPNCPHWSLFLRFHLCPYIPCYTQYHSCSSQTSITYPIHLSLEALWFHLCPPTYIAIPKLYPSRSSHSTRIPTSLWHTINTLHHRIVLISPMSTPSYYVHTSATGFYWLSCPQLSVHMSSISSSF